MHGHTLILKVRAPLYIIGDRVAVHDPEGYQLSPSGRVRVGRLAIRRDHYRHRWAYFNSTISESDLYLLSRVKGSAINASTEIMASLALEFVQSVLKYSPSINSIQSVTIPAVTNVR